MLKRFVALVAFATFTFGHLSRDYDERAIAQRHGSGGPETNDIRPYSAGKLSARGRKTAAFFTLGTFLRGNPFQGINWPGDDYRYCADPKTKVDQCVKRLGSDAFGAAFAVYVTHLSYNHGYKILLGMMGGGGGGGDERLGPEDVRKHPSWDDSLLLPHPVVLYENDTTVLPGHSYSARLENTTWDRFGHEQRYYESKMLDLTTGQWRYAKLHHNVTSGVNIATGFHETADQHRRRARSPEPKHKHPPKTQEGEFFYLFHHENKENFHRVVFDSEILGELADQAVHFGEKTKDAVFCADLFAEGAESNRYKINRGMFAVFPNKDHEGSDIQTRLERALDQCR